MPLFKKKQEKVEKAFGIPELPSFPEVQEIKEALKPREVTNEVIPPLPAFPSFSNYPPPVQAQQLQKPDIKKIEEIGLPVWREQRVPLTQELNPMQQIIPPQITTPFESAQERTEERILRAREPIFIKIDKFSEALSNFESIKKKVEEIDDLLKRTREIRQKEQEEFNAWEKEIIEIKEKINSIDEKLFSKLE